MTRQRRRRLIRTRRTVTGLSLVASIAFLAGMTDAVGLMLTGNFVSFMTGNTTRAAIALGTGDFGHAAVLFSAILTFIAGNALGIVVAHAADRRAFVVLACVSILLAMAAGFGEPSLVLVQFYLVVLAMGMVNATVEHIEGLPIGLTYVTGALSRFGRGIGRFLLGDRDFAWRVQIVPWSGMISGAIIGALLANSLGARALWLVSMVALALALSTLFIPRRLQRRFNQRLIMAAPAAPRAK
ncbi:MULTISPECIES: YoaK family protein [unclassified Rhizobium]|jgi:uncharacterized membrane protein YoaK (UPF0700 family)|uniref:YoaK family protein n=1 Tax=unclassified Rhizobium TaxID=2613769 RepID=UPI000646DD82|nr:MULTISPECIES: YoaK family protein [unclassified Rhizobium]MBN8953775.1 DUF1275 domain-containing protein [Rhizobium tropici]OJY72415.1 MAG: hypothetical protein BGP09_04695 [Rhizobium sp. 60-20]RKD50844.1 uncharacterized membrane protein YoaK (UPF0700 family) [Rhizobium sp. WW_1]